MNLVDLIKFQLDSTYDQDGWYPPMKAALAGVTAEQASWRPAGEAANTIWETLNHLIYYKERVLERANGGSPVFPYKDNTETFEAGKAAGDEAAWQAALARLDAIHQGFKTFLATQTDEQVTAPLGNGTIAQTLANILLHDAYHTGQVVMVRKLQGSWPAKNAYS